MVDLGLVVAGAEGTGRGRSAAPRFAQTAPASGGRLAEEGRGFVEKVGTDGLGLGDGLAERNEIDDIALESHHGAERLLVHGVDGGHTPKRVASTRSKVVGVPPRWI